MTGHQLARYRKERKRTQVETARALGVSQTYLSLLETGKRPVTNRLQRKAAKFFDLSPTEVPAHLASGVLHRVSDDQLASDLADLGYIGFSHLKRARARKKNPADVLLSGLNSPKRDARLVEALPWLVLHFPNLRWGEVARAARMHDLQNRLGYVVSVARGLAEKRGDEATADMLKHREAELQHSMLAREDTLCNETMSQAERRWLNENRPDEAKHWRVLTSLSPQRVRYAD
jgi:transcriptional regulator with XRE-family HTH domain